ncbi:unnamed protein product [Clonostachys rhizophaga]|uniref:Aldehyde dehydrogenase domain-containing protein n=1 Tax=Clonostachys rhizophaga TaxID=160324 RepID=A0A9N9V9H3_9HYPO|nr:unnamed protein product [Clonostachys rhizophaga]
MSSAKTTITAPNGRQITINTGLFISNEWVAPVKEQEITSINPATEEAIVSVSAAGPEDVDKAVSAARAAFEGSWADVVGTERGRLLMKLADIVEAEMEPLATLVTMENGKPYSQATGDVEEMCGTGRQKFTYTLREPIGVCGQIIPWNYPLGMAGWKLDPCLACGNTTVLKPAEQTPLSILYFADLVVKAGFPPGAINILNGYERGTGSAIVDHPGIDKISFTGSTATGRQIMKSAAVNLKNITLETGGKSPIIIFDDADIKHAIKWTHYGIMGNMGQICTANIPHFHPREDLRRLYEAFLGCIEKISIASSNKPNGRGYFIEPTVVGDVKSSMKVYKEEIFGPFAAVVKFSSEQEVIKAANDTEYGLAAALFTTDVTRAVRISQRLHAGNVWINSNNNSDFQVPFGGMKQSGIGRELGEAGLEAYSTLKAVHLNLVLANPDI